MSVPTLQHYINGKWVDGASGPKIPYMNPLHDTVMGNLPIATPAEVSACVEAAHAAFLKWKEVPVINRIQPIMKLATLIKERAEEIARSVTENHGKEIGASRAEVLRGVQMLESSLCAPEWLKGSYSEQIANGVDEFSVRVPMGVFVCIPPFNFPAMIPFWFFPFAVAAGNSYIIKSNEQTPLSMQLMFECIDKAGFPPGVINYIHGDPSVATALIDHPHVKGVSSVGSTEVAKSIYSRACSHGKRAQCHGGANNTLVVTQRASVDQVMSNILNSCFGNTGQRCLHGSCIMTVGPVAFFESFKEKLIAACKAMKVGDGMDEKVGMGPLISKKSLAKICGQIETCVAAGGKVILDGRELKVPEFPKGYFIGPTLIEGVPMRCPADRDEIFGPVVKVAHVETLEEAMQYINDEPKGNSSVIYTESGDEARKFRHGVQPGMIGVNIGLVAPLAWFPFAGMKDSFFGTLRGQGRDAFIFSTEEHVVIERYHGHSQILWD